MRFKKILFHTHFREMAFSALEAVIKLRRAGLEELILTYIVPREEVAFVPYGGYLKEEENLLREKARIHFEEWQQALSERGIHSRIRIETGPTNATILDIAREEDVSMIVTGHKKRTLLERIYVGSHILDLLRRSPVPVMMAKYLVEYELEGVATTRTNDRIYERPLLATDWSDPSEHALHVLTAFKGVAEKVLVAHIIGSRITKGVNSDEIRRLEKESESRLKAYCEILQNKGVSAEPHLSFGKTVPEIIRTAREYNASMIVLGRTGKDWFEEYWLGGVSHRIAELSELPTLLVP